MSVVDHRLFSATLVFGNDIKLGGPDFSAEETDQTGADNDCGDRRMQKVDGDKGERGERPERFVFKRFPTDPNDRRGDDCDHDRLESIKNRGDPRDTSVGGVDETQCPKDEHRGNDKESASYDSTCGFVQEPSDIDG